MVFFPPNQAATSLTQAQSGLGQRLLVEDVDALLGQIMLLEADFRQVRRLKWQAGRDDQVNPAVVEVDPLPEGISPQQN